MTTAEDFLLVMTDPDSGKSSVGVMESDAVFGGAFLFDLVAAGRLALEGTGRKARVMVVLEAPVDDPVLQAAFARFGTKGRQSPQSAVTKLGKKGRDRTYESLVAKGAVRRRDAKAWGMFPLARYDVVDTMRRDDLVQRIRASLLHDQPADAETGPVIGLLSATNLVKKLVDKPDRKRAEARAKVVSEGDWASEGVRQAIQAAQTAVTTAIIASTVITTTGSS
jgi:hypothetical protein